MNALDLVEKKYMSREIPEFGPGDTVRVSVKIKEGDKFRIQAFEGVVIGLKRRGVRSSIVVRKVSLGYGVERIFPLYSPLIESIDRIKRGRVRRAKLYYLRGRKGKAARIKEIR
jgi:large subunit ribosomal protein L19